MSEELYQNGSVTRRLFTAIDLTKNNNNWKGMTPFDAQKEMCIPSCPNADRHQCSRAADEQDPGGSGGAA